MISWFHEKPFPGVQCGVQFLFQCYVDWTKIAYSRQVKHHHRIHDHCHQFHQNHSSLFNMFITSGQLIIWLNESANSNTSITPAIKKYSYIFEALIINTWVHTFFQMYFFVSALKIYTFVFFRFLHELNESDHAG